MSNSANIPPWDCNMTYFEDCIVESGMSRIFRAKQNIEYIKIEVPYESKFKSFLNCYGLLKNKMEYFKTEPPNINYFPEDHEEFWTEYFMAE